MYDVVKIEDASGLALADRYGPTRAAW